jgi:hypothetical protein
MLLSINVDPAFSAIIIQYGIIWPIIGGLATVERPCPLPQTPDVAGAAALAICESLLLALNDHNILPEREIVGILKDAAAAHHHMPENDGDAALHAAVAALINGILAGGNSVRRR